MKRTREYKIGVVLFVLAIILFGAAFVAGLMQIDMDIERICFFLGIAFDGFGFMYITKAKDIAKDM